MQHQLKYVDSAEDYTICYDINTKVMYYITDLGAMCPIYNADGSLALYRGNY